MGIASLGRQWFELVLRTNKIIVYISVIFYVFPIQAQLSAFDKAESFFYNKEFDKASLFYKNVIQNEYSSKKEVAFSKCRLSLINNNYNDIKQYQKYLEESLSDNVLPLSISSICSYALLQIYYLLYDYKNAVILSKKMGNPNLQPLYLARFYALSAESGRNIQNKDFERSQLVYLLNIMKKNNIQSVDLNKNTNKIILLSDIESRLNILNFENNLDSNFQNNFIENVFLLKMKEGEFQLSLDILEKNIVKNPESILLESGFLIENSKLRSRLVHLNHDDPQEMRIGLILSNREDRQKYNQNVLRAISAFFSSTAVQGVHYKIEIEEANSDEGSLSTAALNLIFDKHIHTLIVAEGFKGLKDLNYLVDMFSIPTIFPEKNNEMILSSKKDLNYLKIISENGRFKNSFEELLNSDLKTLGVESKIFDAFILLRNLQYLANGSQNAQINKIMKDGNWKIDGVSIYEGFGSVR